MFPCEFSENFQNNSFTEHLWAASVLCSRVGMCISIKGWVEEKREWTKPHKMVVWASDEFESCFWNKFLAFVFRSSNVNPFINGSDSETIMFKQKCCRNELSLPSFRRNDTVTTNDCFRKIYRPVSQINYFLFPMKSSEKIADELFESVWPFCGTGA